MASFRLGGQKNGKKTTSNFCKAEPDTDSMGLPGVVKTQGVTPTYKPFGTVTGSQSVVKITMKSLRA